MMNPLRKILLAALAWAALALPAYAQSSPGWTYGYVPTPAQWNAAFAGKQDYVGSAFLPLSGGTMTGRLTTSTPNSSGAGFTLPQGADPSAPNNGDLWTTSLGLKARINGVTYNLTAGGFPIVVGTTTITGGSSGAPLFNNAGVLGNGLIASTWSTFQQVGTGSVSRTVQNKLQPWFDVEDFGAVGNGVADDAPAIRAAMLAAFNAGGGSVIFSPNKVYLAKTKYTAVGSGITIFPHYSNVSVRGPGGTSAVVKVDAAMNQPGSQFMVFYPPDSTATYTYTNLGYYGFKIDENGVNNAANAAQNVAIGCNYCTAVTIVGMTFANNPGSQYVQLGQNASLSFSQGIIANNRFLDACDMIAGSPCTDFSAIYAVGSDYTITGNNFVFTGSSIYATAIEMHGIDGVATGNVIEGYAKACNIAAQITHTARNLIFSNNSGTVNKWGCSGFALDGQVMENILIDSNNFLRSSEPVGSGLGFFDFGVNTFVTNGNSRNIKITNNQVRGLQALGTAAVDPVIVIGRMQGIEVRGNQIYNSNGPCIGNNGNTLDANTRWVVEDNTCVDVGGTSTAGSRRGILLSSATSIAGAVISRNKIQNVASTYVTTGIDVSVNVTGGAGLILPDNYIINVATPVNMNASTGWQQIPGNALAVSGGPGQPLGPVAVGTDDQVLFGRTSAIPLFRTVTGDVTFATGVATIGPNKVTYSKFQQSSAGNVVLGNATSGVAAYSEQAMPSCSTAFAALKWTTNTGFGCNNSLAGLGSNNVFTGTQEFDAQTTWKAAANTGVSLENAGGGSIRSIMSWNGASGGYMQLNDTSGGQGVLFQGALGGTYKPTLTFGSTTAITGSSGEVGFAKITASGTAPGAASCKIFVEAGTTGGTCRISAYCGTSTTKATVLDNIGSGC